MTPPEVMKNSQYPPISGGSPSNFHPTLLLMVFVRSLWNDLEKEVWDPYSAHPPTSISTKTIGSTMLRLPSNPKCLADQNKKDCTVPIFLPAV